MKKRLFRLSIITALLCFLFGFQAMAANRLQTTLTYDGVSHAYDQLAIELYVDGQKLSNLPLEPVLIGTRTYVPVREVFESMGATVDWLPVTKQVYITYGDKTLLLQIGNRTMKVNADSVVLEVAPMVINNKTMVPVSFVASALQFKVTADWAATHRHVFLDPPGSTTPTLPPQPTPSPVPTATPQALDAAIDISKGDIPAMTYITTNITGISLPRAGSQDVYIINASGAVSRVEKLLLQDNRLVLDIYNAEITMQEKNIMITDNNSIKAIRAAQNQLTPEKVTRVVFELSPSVRYAVALSADRRQIMVALNDAAVNLATATAVATPTMTATATATTAATATPSPTITTVNTIQEVNFVSEAKADKLTLVGKNSAPKVTVTKLTNPLRLVIEMPVATLAKQQTFSVVGLYAKQVRTEQVNATTARVTLTLLEDADYAITSSGKNTVIKLTEPSRVTVEYDKAKGMLVLDKTKTGLRVSSFTHVDEYLKKRYTFILPGDYSSQLGSGTYTVGDSLVQSYTVQNVSGKTQIVFNEAQILAFNVTEDDSKIYIQPVKPSQKYAKIVIIDPGHGGSQPGTSGFGMVEKNLNLDIAKKLIAMLEADGRVKVYATRLDDSHVSLGDRAKFANDLGDLFISIHNNAVVGRPSVSGTESHYLVHSNDAAIGISSKTVATIMQKYLIQELGSVDRKIISSNFQVLRETTIPAVLVEIGFLTNQAENAKLATSEYQGKAATALFKAIIEVFEQYKPAR